MRKWIFIIDAHSESGLGHIRRSSALAQAMLPQTLAIWLYEGNLNFINSTPLDSNLFQNQSHFSDLIQSLKSLRSSQFGLIIDSYRLSDTDLQELRKQFSGPLIVFDDDGQRHQCPIDLFLAPGFAQKSSKYPRSIYESSLSGPEYTIIDPKIHSITTQPRTPIRSLLISFGGSDPLQCTERCLKILLDPSTPPLDNITIVLGPHFKNTKQIASFSQQYSQLHTLRYPVDLINLSSEFDLALCGGGVSAYEFLGLGLPIMALAQADNQLPLLEGLTKHNCGFSLGDHRSISDTELQSNIIKALQSEDSIKKSQKGKELIDGLGAQRIAQRLQNI